MNTNDERNELPTPDEERLGQPSEGSVRAEPSLTGTREGGGSGNRPIGREAENRAPEGEDRITSPSLRESQLDELIDPFAELRLFRPTTDASAEESAYYVRKALEVSNDIIRSVETHIRNHFSERISSVISSIEYCDSCIRGCFGRICDRSEEILAKCEKKIRSRIDDAIANSYYYTFNFFGAPPTTEELLSELGLSSNNKTPIDITQPYITPGTGRLQCPPGYELVWDRDRHVWECWSACPEGTVRDPLSKQCLPEEKPPKAEPEPKPPECPVEYPKAPGTGISPAPTQRYPEPPCPQPADLVCPPGQIAAFVNGVWKCVPIDKAPGIGEPTDETNTVCPTDSKKEPCLAWNETSFLEFALPNWNQANICDALDAIKTRSEIYQGKLSEIIPWKFDSVDDKWIVPPEVHHALQGLDRFTRAAILGVGGLLVSAVDLLMPVIPKIGDCDMSLLVPVQIIDALLDLIEKYTGFRCNALTNSLQYLINYICPSQLPSQGDIDKLYHTRQISESTWRCLTRAIGNYDYWAKLIREVNAPQLTPDELVVAYFRGVITRQQLERELTHVYGLPQHIAENYVRLKVALPGSGDIVSFMVRDVADPKVVEKYGYDSEFDEKFQGKLREWAANLGIEEEVFKYYWRAHWELPSPTQLYEMLRRLRKDSVDPEARALALTKEEIAEALAANDVPKFWRDRLMAVSYLPMTLSDAKIAYIEGAIDEATFKSLIKDSGRNEQHTQWIFELADRQKKRRTMSLVGGFTPTKITNWFKIGAIDDAMARRLYVEAGLTEELAEKAVRVAKTAIRSERIEQRIKLVKKRYLVGDLSPDQARNLLLKIGAELNRVNELIEDWELEIQIRSKQVAAQTLCEWYYRKLITEEEYAVRLRRIGFQPQDVERIIASCAVQSAEKAFDRKVKTAKGLKFLQESQKPKGNGKKEPK